jgi:DNA-binding NtrC family response regulator
MSILVITECQEARSALRHLLEIAGFDVIETGQGEWSNAMSGVELRAVICDHTIAQQSVEQLLSQIRSQDENMPVVVVTDDANEQPDTQPITDALTMRIRKSEVPTGLVFVLRLFLRGESEKGR